MWRPRLSLAAILILLAVPALAQRTSATVRGTVTDSSASVIPGATVTLQNESTGFTRDAVTNEAGFYSFAELPIGTYTLSVELSGFKTATRTNIVLNVADDRAVDIVMEPGAVTETITVQAAAQSVRTIGGDVSGVVTGAQVRELPLNGRNFLQLATLMPGVSAPDFLNVKDKGLLGGSDLAVSGGGVTANLWTVDGTNNNDVGSNRTILVYPSVEAIEEFKILRNAYGAEFGQSGGAQVNIVTRGGTNEFHGSGFYFGRDDSLVAKDFFLKRADQPKQELSRHDFGWTLGGPIVRDRLHFFASQEWNRERLGSVRQAFVPTAAERAGDFSGERIPGCSSPIPLDPLTGQPFAGNRIPADRLSPGGLLFLQLYPLPNATPPSGTCNNWVQSLTTPIDYRQENIRLDYTVSDASRVMVRYTQDTWRNNSPNKFGNLWGDDPFPAVDSNWDQPGKSFMAQLNQTLGSTAVNTLTFSYSANKIEVTRGGTDPDLNAEINAAIPGLFPDNNRLYGSDRGHPVFWGGQGYGQALWNEAPFNNNQDLFILRDDYSAVFGNHVLKAGGLFSFNKKNEDVGGYGSFENSAFWGSTGLNNFGPTTGNILADFLLRDMTFGFSENSAQRPVPQRWRDLELYVSDSWKASSRLTVDYGVRYSLLFNPYAADNTVMVFDPASFDPALGNDPCNGLLQVPDESFCEDAGFRGASPGPNRSLYPQDTNNFAPRLGVAWDPTGEAKTSLRAGLGLFYLRERLSPGLNIGGNPPFRVLRTGIRKLDSAAEPCPGCFSNSAGSPTAGREQRGATPHNWQWNLMFQHEILRNTTVEVGYVGNKGDDLLKTHDANQVRVGDRNNNGIQDRVEFARLGNAIGGAVRPFGVFGDTRITMWDHAGHSMYHSLQSQIISRFGRGSHFQASYTLSRQEANEPMDNSDGNLNANMSTLDLDNLEAEEGLARTDRTHIFNASLVLMMSPLEGRPAAMRHILGDWQIGTIVSAASGQPLNIFVGSIPGLTGGISGTGYVDNQRPNRVPDVSCRAEDGAEDQILNPAAYTIAGMEFGSIGNARRGDCRGPGVFQVDMAFYKNIAATDRFKLQLRFEIFNVLNRTNFIGTGGVGVNTTLSPTTVTFDAPTAATATRVVNFTPSGNFGRAVATRDPRQMQFGLKVTF
jgi:hypothetical protein